MGYSMKKVVALIGLISALASTAQAAEWTQATGLITMTRYKDSSGKTLDDIPLSNRIETGSFNLRERSTSGDGNVTNCKTNRAFRQRVCKGGYDLGIDGEGSCRFTTKAIFYNYTSSKKNIKVSYEATGKCQSGFRKYLKYEGTVTRRR